MEDIKVTLELTDSGLSLNTSEGMNDLRKFQGTGKRGGIEGNAYLDIVLPIELFSGVSYPCQY